MHSESAEVVFALNTASNAHALIKHEPGLFHYANGPVKVPGPWKRGRPKGSINKGSKSSNWGTKKPPSSVFEFVNVSGCSKDVDKTARARIRRHARLCLARQVRRQRDITPDHRQSEEPIHEEMRVQVRQAVPKISLQQILEVDPFDQSPIKLEPYMHDLLRFYTDTVWKDFYALEYMAGYNPVAEYWLYIAFEDPALIHIFIGCADVYTRGYSAIVSGTKGLRHFYEAISLVNRRLQDAYENVSETTLAIIAALAMLEKGAGRHRNWQVHMQGLKELVDRRGGPENLSSNPFVVNKIYRADLYGALDAVEPPYFEGPSGLLPRSSSKHLFRSPGFNALLGIINLDQGIKDSIYLLEEAMSLWSDAKDKIDIYSIQYDGNTSAPFKKPTSAQVARARQLLTEAQYILISGDYKQSITTHAQSDRVSEHFRLTLILYSITILHEPAPSKFIDRRIGDIFRQVYTDLMSNLDNVLFSSPAAVWTSTVPIDFHLWALLLAAPVTDMITESETRSWLLTSFDKLVSPEYGDIRDWHDLKSRLSRFLWIPDIHDQTAWLFWLEVLKVREGNHLIMEEAKT